MKTDIKKLNEKYNKSIAELPLKDLGEIIYNKQKKAMENMTNKDAPDISGEIAEIMENVEFNKRAYLNHKLFMATYDHDAWNNESWFIYHKKLMLFKAVQELICIESLKSHVDDLTKLQRKTKKLKEDIDCISYFLNSDIERQVRYLELPHNTIKQDLSNLKDVFAGEKEEKEIYRPLSDFKFIENENTYITKMYSEIYDNEDFFTISFGGMNDYLIAVITDYLDGSILNTKDGLYSLAENETNKVLKRIPELPEDN